jgi:hypothetical protein
MIHQTCFAFLLALFVAIVPFPANHPFHICVGEMDWDDQRGCWEVALRLHAEDLQHAMAKVGRKAVELQPGDLPPELGKVLEDHFFITESLADQKPNKGSSQPTPDDGKQHQQATADAEGNRSLGTKVSRLELVGTEASRGWFWVYFRLYESKPESPEGSPSAKADRIRFLHHTILLDQVEDQSNTLLVRQGNLRKSLTFQSKSQRSPWPAIHQASK